MFDRLLEFDRSITLALNGSDSIVMDKLMTIVTSTIVWIPMGLFLLYIIYRYKGLKTTILVFGGIMLCVFFADMVAAGIIKPLVGRLRPSNEPMLIDKIDLVNNYRGGWYGFFSCHAANTMSVAVFLSLLLHRWSIALLLVLWSLLNCWSRLYLGVHYMGDILVGLMWGAIVGWSIYMIMRRSIGSMQEISVRPANTAILITFAVIVVLVPILAT
ncbi:MAG: phosphatase PAP2 family protein [Bacteroidaceae bacterium]|nr:phosphatase PAP2 family protein [Bacteroidaceae bacterium]